MAPLSLAHSEEIAPARLLQRPIYGGIFGDGRYSLASMPCVSRGLYVTQYLVIEPQGGADLSMAEDKVQALEGARRVLHAANDGRAEPARPPQQLELLVADANEDQGSRPVAAPAARVSRRRRDIFDKSGGRCHYCDAALVLHDEWHGEHMMPRALGGGDDPLNLVAACARCNLAKADRTALEFIAMRRPRAA